MSDISNTSTTPDQSLEAVERLREVVKWPGQGLPDDTVVHLAFVTPRWPEDGGPIRHGSAGIKLSDLRLALALISRQQAENERLKDALEPFARRVSEDHDHLPDELVVTMSYDSTEYDAELGGPNELLGEPFLRAFRTARQALQGNQS